MLLAALLTLRRVAIHHHALLASSLPAVAALLLECLQGGDPAVAQAAAMCLLDLFVSFGSAMLRVLGPPPPTEDTSATAPPLPSCLLGLLLAAALGRTPAIRHWAGEALR